LPLTTIFFPFFHFHPLFFSSSLEAGSSSTYHDEL
jgi:hypothetical protein